jgi:hypothetical protein
VPADPFATLGLTAEASADDVRAARRQLALEHHPDRGGDPNAMRAVNEAAAAALRRLTDGGTDRSGRSGSRDRGPRGRPSPGGRPPTSGVARDVPSFSVEALPVHTFEALLLAAAVLGDVLDDDPPYRLDAALGPPLSCWCRLDVLPDAGSSTVTLTIGSLGDQPAPSVEAVRDAWIAELNSLDWDTVQSDAG